MVFAKEHEIRGWYPKMASNEGFQLSSMALESVTELARFPESGEGWDHVPVIVKSLLFCDLLPFGNRYGEFRHGYMCL